MNTNIPKTSQKRVVVIGAGFAGLKVASTLIDSDLQVVMIDKENYHQFQPLIYQVATSGLEPSAIAFPVRKNFQRAANFYFRLAKFESVEVDKKQIVTSIGVIQYDYLVLATGTTTNYYGLQNVERAALPMKSVSEAITLRNHILQTLEKAVLDPQDESLRTIVIVGGGATGVEIAGALADMRRYVIKKDYPELRELPIRIVLAEASPKVLGVMHERSSSGALKTLLAMGVEVKTNCAVADYVDSKVVMRDGTQIATQTLIWVSGVTVEPIAGLDASLYARGGRIKVDGYNQVEGADSIFVAGDAALQSEGMYSAGHPQVAPVAIGQGQSVARNIIRHARGEQMVAFAYKSRGSMATIGRGQAVVDMGDWHWAGFAAWITWLGVHLLSILGTRNKIQTTFNWFWNYITFDQSLRLIIRPTTNKKKESSEN
ncbi:MAG: NAD(P)/FAD-dependent oxidoreductase [Mucinivorans sp.]